MATVKLLNSIKAWLKSRLTFSNIKAQIKKLISKEAFIQFVLKFILKNFATGGIKLWLAKFIVGEFYDEIGEPIINMVLNNIGYEVRVERNKRILKKIPNSGSANEHDENINDVFRP